MVRAQHVAKLGLTLGIHMVFLTLPGGTPVVDLGVHLSTAGIALTPPSP